MEREGRQIYEEYAYVLDYLPHGKPGVRSRYRGGLIQVIGEDFFTLLEAVVREGSTVNINERVYVGKKGREKVIYIVGRIGYDELTNSATQELTTVIEMIVSKKESFFVNFFNTAQAMTPRMHALELIPGIGKKYMWQIIGEREKKPFESFEEIQKRINLPNPARLIAKRILEELSGKDKYSLFTRPR